MNYIVWDTQETDCNRIWRRVLSDITLTCSSSVRQQQLFQQMPRKQFKWQSLLLAEGHIAPVLLEQSRKSGAFIIELNSLHRRTGWMDGWVTYMFEFNMVDNCCFLFPTYSQYLCIFNLDPSKLLWHSKVLTHPVHIDMQTIFFLFRTSHHTTKNKGCNCRKFTLLPVWIILIW